MPSTARRPLRTYSTPEKIALVTEIERRYHAGGGALDVIARTLGTTATSYHNWVRRGIRPLPAPLMRPVEITSLVPVATAPLVEASIPLTLVTPGGHRVEGLSVETAAALVKALS